MDPMQQHDVDLEPEEPIDLTPGQWLDQFHAHMGSCFRCADWQHGAGSERRLCEGGRLIWHAYRNAKRLQEQAEKSANRGHTPARS